MPKVDDCVSVRKMQNKGLSVNHNKVSKILDTSRMKNPVIRSNRKFLDVFITKVLRF